MKKWISLLFALCAVSFLLIWWLESGEHGVEQGEGAQSTDFGYTPLSGQSGVRVRDGPSRGTAPTSSSTADSSEPMSERYKREFPKEAERRSIPLADVIAERIARQLAMYPPRATQWDGWALLLSLEEAFRDDPVPYLQALLATLRGLHLEQAVESYASFAQKNKDIHMFESAYQVIPPGGNRCHIAGHWAALLGRTKGFDAAYGLMNDTLELPEERQSAAAYLLRIHDRGLLQLTPEELKKLKPE